MVVPPALSFSLQPEECWVWDQQPHEPCHRPISWIIYSVLQDQQLQNRLVFITDSGFAIKMHKAVNWEDACPYKQRQGQLSPMCSRQGWAGLSWAEFNKHHLGSGSLELPTAPLPWQTFDFSLLFYTAAIGKPGDTISYWALSNNTAGTSASSSCFNYSTKTGRISQSSKQQYPEQRLSSAPSVLYSTNIFSSMIRSKRLSTLSYDKTVQKNK